MTLEDIKQELQASIDEYEGWDLSIETAKEMISALTATQAELKAKDEEIARLKSELAKAVGKIKTEVSGRLEASETEYGKERDPYYEGKATALGSLAMWLIQEFDRHAGESEGK